MNSSLRDYLFSIFALLIINTSFAQELVLTYCDDSGFTTLNIKEFEEELLQRIGQEDDSLQEQILISTSEGNILKIDSPSTNPVSNLFCEFDLSITDIAVDLDKKITFTAGSFTTVDDECNFDFYIYSAFSVNSLSFDNLGYMYYGQNNQSYVTRVEIENDTFDEEMWHDFQSGNAAGDFIYLNGKMYIAWQLSSSDFRLYEITVDQDNNYVSHQDLGQIPNKTFGLAAEFGKLYGVTINKLYEIDLNTFTFTDIYLNDDPTDEWYGAAGLHEAIVFETSTYLSLEDAENGENELEGNWTNTQSGGQTIFIRVDNIYTGDYDIYPVVINVTPYPDVNPPNDLSLCYENNFGTYDLNQVVSQMLIDENDDFSFTFYNSNPEENPDADPISNQYQSNNYTESLYVKVDNGGCSSTYSFNLNNNKIPELLPLTDIESPTLLTSCYFDENDIGYFDLKDIDSQIILNNENNNFETSYYSSFSHAEIGINSISDIQYLQMPTKEVFIRVEDEKGCFSISNFFLLRDCINNTESLTSIYFPDFITPNNDGFNDYWNVKGISRKVKKESKIVIFDRYGKFIESFRPYESIGWDGTYNGNQLPSSDYWFIFTTNSGFKKTGHFTLKR